MTCLTADCTSLHLFIRPRADTRTNSHAVVVVFVLRSFLFLVSTSSPATRIMNLLSSLIPHSLPKFNASDDLHYHLFTPDTMHTQSPSSSSCTALGMTFVGIIEPFTHVETRSGSDVHNDYLRATRGILSYWPLRDFRFLARV